MKKLLLLFVLLTSLLSLKSQEIKKDFIDEFEGIRIIETGWVRFVSGAYYYSLNFKSIDTKIIMALQINPITYSVSEGEGKVIFLLSDGKTIRFSNMGYETGAISKTLNLSLTSDNLSFLFSDININKMRIYTTERSIEYEFKSKKSDEIIASYKLLYDRMKKYGLIKEDK